MSEGIVNLVIKDIICMYAGLISVDNLQLLCELLEVVERFDLADLIKEFIDKKESKF